MILFDNSYMLQMLEKSLRKRLPESLKVYGTVFHMNQGNPFKLKALVDKWPDFDTVVVRPQEQPGDTEMNVGDGEQVPILKKLTGSCNEEMFKHSTLDVTHAALVDKFWYFGGNRRSQRFIERCIQSFPTLCLLGPEGTPVTWALMDQSGELRMGATVPKYRSQGLGTYVLYSYVQSMDKLGFPTYNHADKANKISQKMNHTLQLVPMPCDWNQWNCVPL
ncbi:glycine N-acyltransferase-like protein [Orycteropus afer afer]|uniref:Glycine N-acyltransferase-like protein n=1 Tax=Orycteropus afer afer TaxID=1230840 RepID=A0A8B7B093_ORYAF|nr:glycine N-acyltransferase-like protein [Orycteropus afer afer]